MDCTDCDKYFTCRFVEKARGILENIRLIEDGLDMKEKLFHILAVSCYDYKNERKD